MASGKGDKQNFETMLEAAKQGDLALLEMYRFEFG